jgi:hypothetical protein
MKPLVAWKKCSKPKRKGGLGIINLRSQNKALLLKHLDKFYNKKKHPMGKFGLEGLLFQWSDPPCSC